MGLGHFFIVVLLRARVIALGKMDMFSVNTAHGLLMHLHFTESCSRLKVVLNNFLTCAELLLVCSFYLAVRKEAILHLVDGIGHRPHYSLRTLCRALKYVAGNPCISVQRSLYEVGEWRENIF